MGHKSVRVYAESYPFRGEKILGIGEFFIVSVALENARRLAVICVNAAFVRELRFAVLFEHFAVCAEQLARGKALRGLCGVNGATRGRF